MLKVPNDKKTENVHLLHVARLMKCFHHSLALILNLIPFILLLLLPSTCCQQGLQMSGVSEPKVAPNFHSALAPASLGQAPAVDLVAMNLRRFELNHKHPSGESKHLGKELERAQFIESQLSAIPEKLTSRLPDHMLKQVIESFSADPSLVLASATATGGVGLSTPQEDPDEASIVRLTKSCLTVQASSQSVEQLNVTFHLYTRRNPLVPFIMRAGITRAELMAVSPLDTRKPIKWITHGFHTNLDKSEWMLAAKDKILAHEDANVILTDWRRGASPTLAFYPRAAANAHVVAKMIVKILRRLREDLELNSVHLIGHSLGAHIMGFVGSAFTEEHLQLEQARQAANITSPVNQTNGRLINLIGRVTACDPALPCFGPSSSGPNSRMRQAMELQRHQQGTKSTSPTSGQPHQSLADTWLTPTMWTHLRPDSALLVEVLHSNPGVMGYAEPLGDYDFYPNGSDRQPGCGGGSTIGATNRRRRRRRALLDQIVKPIRDFFHTYTCSHHRSVEYMVESMYYNEQHQSQQDATNEPTPPPIQCQMVGYRCASYEAFQRGHCFRCQSKLDCRSFGLTRTEAMAVRQKSVVSSAMELASSSFGYAPTLASQFASQLGESTTSNVQRRAMPSTSYNALQLKDYKPLSRNEYFFDTKPSPDEHGGDFCLHHYHFLVRYRWFRLASEELQVDRLLLVGDRGQMSLLGQPSQLNRFTRHAYTMLRTWPHHLGQLQSLLVYVADAHEFRANFRPQLIDFIQVSYLSNLNSALRERSSARLCRAQSSLSSGQQPTSEMHLLLLGLMPNMSNRVTSVSLFVRCRSATSSTTTTTTSVRSSLKRRKR